MDYDQTDIAAVYDKGRWLTPETRQQTRQLLSAYIDPAAVSLVVDLGCGTGRFCELLAAHFDAEIIGIEPSQTMLDQARRKLGQSDIVLRRALAEALPLADSCADLIFMSNVYHHLDEPRVVAQECRRVLRPGGRLCLRTGTREIDFPQRRFFPAIERLIDAELPSRPELAANFTETGFTLAAHEVVTQVVAADWPAFVEKSATRADSFLARIDDDAFNSGMAALRAHGASINAGLPVTEEIDWFVFAKETA